jgi:hypothetical protein
MFFPLSAFPRKLQGTILVPVLALLLTTTPGIAATTVAAAQAIPVEYGQVIYHKDGNRDSHLFIIFQSHRNAGNGSNGPNTVAVQSEIYRIGEWLIRHENVGLLLPEGYFNQRSQHSSVQPASFRRGRSGAQRHFLDDATLKKVLQDTSRFINADRLLMESYGIRLQQVEDQDLYHSILDFLFRPSRQQGLDEREIGILSYMQEKRSAGMLQAIPAAIDRELRQGGIIQRKAIFTIGLAHLNEMIRFLQEGKIEIYSPLLQEIVDQGPLKLLDADYGITIIIPRSLAEDQEAIRIANLDRLR